MAEDTDRKYIEALCERVIGSVYREPQSEILLGGTLIPVPPATIGNFLFLKVILSVGPICVLN